MRMPDGGSDAEQCMKCIVSMALRVWITTCLLYFSFTEASADEKLLYKTLFDGYVPEVRPRLDPNDAVVVKIDLNVNQIKELDVRSETLYTVGFILLEWDDEYLKWNPGNYSGIKDIVVPPYQIWLPDCGIKNSAEKFYDSDFFKYFRTHISHTGHVMWSFSGVFKTSCDIDTVLFPFDVQSCPIVFENWAYTNRSVALANSSAEVRLETYHENGIWELIGNRVELELKLYGFGEIYSYSHLEFTLHLRRKPRYYLVNILIPCIFLTSIALLVFWLPPEAGEKVSLGITVLLSFSVFQVVIAGHTPETSDSTPILSIFVTMTMCLSTVSVMTTVLVLNLHHRQPYHTVPRWLRFIAIDMPPRIRCMSARKLDSMSDSKKKTVHAISSLPVNGIARKDEEYVEMYQMEDDAPVIQHVLPFFRDLSKQVERVSAEIKNLTDHIRSRDREKEVHQDWMTVAKVIDRLLFWIVLGVFVGCVVWLSALTIDLGQAH